MRVSALLDNSMVAVAMLSDNRCCYPWPQRRRGPAFTEHLSYAELRLGI